MLLGEGEINWMNAFPPIVQWVIAITIGASTVGIPLYAKMRKMAQDIKLGTIEIDGREKELKVQEKANAQELKEQEKVNADAEFQRILKYRDDEIKRLTERDEAQEKRINELFLAHLECARNEARQDERSKMNTEKIQTLERKVMMLEMLLHEKGNVPPANVTIHNAGQPLVKAESEAPAPTPAPVLIVPAP